ncbi:elongation factor G [Paenibacillus sanfengchensis]|uniref:elongation factor G n=1 Tax=Paenibacillus sanfengchensis TaxID=3119819 RepID=UPI002FE034D4
MTENTRKLYFDKMTAYLDEQRSLLPDLNMKYLGIALPFPQCNEHRDRVFERIKHLREYDKDVVIGAHFDFAEGGSRKFTSIVFIGNDYLHLRRIHDFMKEQGVELSLKNTCIIYRESTDDIHKKLNGGASRVTSLNDLYASVEVELKPRKLGAGYDFELHVPDQEIVSYCCHKDDEEGLELGSRLFLRSLELYSTKFLSEGVTMGYPVADCGIEVTKMHCRMCFYRDYYYVTGARGSIGTALKKADWQIIEPVMELGLTCSRAYFEENPWLNAGEHVSLRKEGDVCKLTMRSRLSAIMDHLEELHHHPQIMELSMKIGGYALLEENADPVNRFKIIYDMDQWKKDLDDEN